MKKLIAITMSVVMLLGLMACSSKKATNEPKQLPSSETKFSEEEVDTSKNNATTDETDEEMTQEEFDAAVQEYEIKSCDTLEAAIEEAGIELSVPEEVPAVYNNSASFYAKKNILIAAIWTDESGNIITVTKTNSVIENAIDESNYEKVSTMTVGDITATVGLTGDAYEAIQWDVDGHSYAVRAGVGLNEDAARTVVEGIH